MGMFAALQAAGSGMNVFKTWIDSTANNVANMNSISTTPGGEPFRTELVIAQANEDGSGPGAHVVEITHRVEDGSPEYEAGRKVGRHFAERGWAVITGGGPGVMEAANRGAREGGGLSIGFIIVLPLEQDENPYLDIEYTFHHFYARKVCFVRPSEGFVIFPGGFGTLDELYESLTLIQTGKIKHFPVVLFGTDYWGEMIEWIRGELLADGMISADDIELLHITDDAGEAVQLVLDCYERRCADDVPAPHKEDAQ
jgi:uncharacterized protein (TIGR00730 family)